MFQATATKRAATTWAVITLVKTSPAKTFSRATTAPSASNITRLGNPNSIDNRLQKATIAPLTLGNNQGERTRFAITLQMNLAAQSSPAPSKTLSPAGTARPSLLVLFDLRFTTCLVAARPPFFASWCLAPAA